MSGVSNSGHGVITIVKQPPRSNGANPNPRPQMILPESISVVTGGSRGIGLAIARALASGGSRVAINGRSADRVERTVAQLASEGLSVFGRPCDMRNRTEVADFFSAVRAELGQVDILVNNAGLGHLRPFMELTEEQIDETFAVNVGGMFAATRQVLGPMLDRGRGHIVNIASLAGRNGFPGGTAYAASKHAVLGLSRSLMLEVRKKGVHVIAVCPGSVSTDFFQAAGQELPNADRVLEPDDVAAVVLNALTLPERALVSEIDIRPSNP